ncbi:MAG: ECF transporter S component [Clostridia bacterium]|nr:ECF transporter S component [Clostridia bacterium]
MKAGNRTIRLVLLALTASLILLTTLLYIPMGIGYYHLGDGFIFAAAALLGPYAGISAAIGSILADIFSGYLIYAPATAVIKGCMGFVSGWMLKKNHKFMTIVLVLLLCEAIMVGGYFIYESCLYGIAGAVPSLIPNALQGLAGIVLGAIMVPLTKKIPLGNKYLK